MISQLRTAIFSFAIGLLLICGQLGLAVEADFNMHMLETRVLRDGTLIGMIGGVDLQTNRTYAATIRVNGRQWVTSEVHEVIDIGNYRPAAPYENRILPAHGKQKWTKIGLGSDEVQVRFNNALAALLKRSLEKRGRQENDSKSIISDRHKTSVNASGGGRLKSQKNLTEYHRGKALRGNQNGIQETQNNGDSEPDAGNGAGIGVLGRNLGSILPPVEGGAATDSQYEKQHAAGASERIGEFLANAGWDVVTQAAQQASQRTAEIKAQGNSLQQLTAELNARGIQDAAIKANMLIALYNYDGGASDQAVSIKSEAFSVNQGEVVEIFLTKAGQERLLEIAVAQKRNQDWLGLAKTLTYLANPWSGIVGARRLNDFSDRSGVMKGPALKEDGLEITGSDNFKFRLLQAANLIQAAALMSPSFLSSNHLTETFAAVGLALKGSSILRKCGVADEAAKLLAFAEAGVGYLNDVDTGTRIEIFQLATGLVDLGVATAGGFIKIVNDPVAAKESFVELAAGNGKRFYKVLESPNAPELLIKATVHVVLRHIESVVKLSLIEPKAVYKNGSAKDQTIYLG
jgi:hypothetical protein